MLGYVAGEMAARIGFDGGRRGGGRGTSTGGLSASGPCIAENAVGESWPGLSVVLPAWQVVEKLDEVVETHDKSLSSEPAPVPTESEDSYSADESGGDCGRGIAPVQASRLFMKVKRPVLYSSSCCSA